MSDTLVAYFSATGRTAKIAERLGALLGADMYRIVPEVPYTGADLNWHDAKSRSSLETKDLEARPLIAGGARDISSYKRVFIGFPIWWYREPRIIDTFLESEDFHGKEIIPFATSGASSMGKTAEYMRDLVKDAVVRDGRRFSPSAWDEELKDWVSRFLK